MSIPTEQRDAGPDLRISATPRRVLGLAGSPRRHGNTERLLDEFLAGASDAGAQVEKVVLTRLNFTGCVACERCFENGRCAIKDDFQYVFDRLVLADVIVLAAPLYFWNVPAQAKLLIDRSECQWARRFVLQAPLAGLPAGSRPRRGVFISTAGRPEADFAGAILTVEHFFDVWEAAYWGDLLYRDVNLKGAIEAHPVALREAFHLGQRSVARNEGTTSGRHSGISLHLRGEDECNRPAAGH